MPLQRKRLAGDQLANRPVAGRPLKFQQPTGRGRRQD
jgi:hypothetical protein